MQPFLLVPTNQGVGLTSTSLGLMRALEFIGRKPGFMHPFLQTDGELEDHSSALISKHFKISTVKGLPHSYVEKMLGDGKIDDLLEQAVALFEQSKINSDVVIVEGVAPSDKTGYANMLNEALAQALNAKVILVAAADLYEPETTADTIDMFAHAYSDDANRNLAVIVSRIKGLELAGFDGQSPTYGHEEFNELTHRIVEILKPYSPHMGSNKLPIIGVLPYQANLVTPRVYEVAHAIGARWLHEGDAKKRRIDRSVLCARTVSNMLHVFQPGTLVVVPGDRDDVLIAAALSTMNGMNLAGVLLTGGYIPNQSVIDLCRPALGTGLPVLSIDHDSYRTVTHLNMMSNNIPVDDVERTEAVTDYVSNRLDLNWLEENCQKNQHFRLSPSAFRYALVKKAQQARKKIVLPEGAEPRTVQAAIICQTRKIADCILLAPRHEVESVARNHGLTIPPDLQIIDPDSIRHKYAKPMVERRKGKLNEATAEEQLMDNVVLGTMMLYLGEVDGLVSGAVHTTANTVRPAFQLIKTAPEFSLVSSLFFMLLPEQVVVYADCAINPDPTAEELAEIAIQSADSAKAFGVDPRVAMISYSTGSSGAGTDVEKVRAATEIAKQRRPDLMIDGPMQYDAASDVAVGRQKAPDSPVAGHATVYIFPDLNTGNTTYKAVQRSANVVSVGPMLQGLNKPVNDLSRGALIEDIVYTIALTSVQAMSC